MTLRRLAAIALALLCLTAQAFATAQAQAVAQPPVTGQTPRPGAGDLRMEVLAVTGTITPGGTLRTRVRVVNSSRREAEDLRIVVTVHRKVFHRSDFQQALDEGRLGNLLGSVTTELEPVAGRRVRNVELEQDGAEFGFSGSDDRFGVYPVRIQLLAEGDVVDEVRTAVVYSPPEVEIPLRAALVVPLDTRPALGPDGTVMERLLRSELAPRGRLHRLLDAFGRPGVPLTLAASGRMLDDLAEIAADTEMRVGRLAGGLLARLREIAALPQTEQVALPYGPADLVALVRGGMRSEVVRHLIEGMGRVEDHTGVRPQRGVLYPPAGLDSATLAEAASVGVDTVVLAESWLDLPEGRELPSSPSPVRRLRTGAGSTATALVPDPWLTPVLAQLDELPPAVAAQRVLAETAVLYFERPFAEDLRGVLLDPPRDWDPEPDVLARLVEGLGSAPWLRPVTLTGLRSEVAAEREPLRLSYPSRGRGAELSQDYVASLRLARRALGSLRGVLADDAATPARFDRMLLTAASVFYRIEPREGLALIDTVARTVAELYDAVAVAEGPTVLLSSVDGQVPVTLANTAEVPMRVLVRLETQRFEFQGGAVREVLLEPESRRTVVFEAHALAPGGTWPIGVVIADVDGEVELARGTVVVRSTAVSLAALVITAGAGLFLVVWWLRSATRRRRERREQPVVEVREAGGIVAGGLVRLLAVTLLFALVVYEGGAIAVNRFQLDGMVADAARVGAFAWQQRGGAASTEQAVTARLEDETNIEILELSVQRDVLRLAISRRARTLVAHRLGFLDGSVRPVVRRERPLG